MENRKVDIVSTVDAVVTVESPQLRFNRTWERRGTVRPIELDVLKELVYETGFWNMLIGGILYIPDMEVKKELGLEPEDAEEPQNVIILTDAQKKRYLTVMPQSEFEANCAKLTKTELNNLVDYAIQNEIINYDKATYLKNITERDIIKSIEFNRTSTD